MKEVLLTIIPPGTDEYALPGIILVHTYGSSPSPYTFISDVNKNDDNDDNDDDDDNDINTIIYLCCCY
jgi:hypothetical protein